MSRFITHETEDFDFEVEVDVTPIGPYDAKVVFKTITATGNDGLTREVVDTSEREILILRYGQAWVKIFDETMISEWEEREDRRRDG